MDEPLAYSPPEAQGIPSTAIASFAAAAEERLKSLHSFMLLRHGRLVAEAAWHPYTLSRPHMMFSVSKSFTSTAVGLAAADGLLSVDDPVTSFFPDVVARPSGNLTAMRVKHLLTMTTGHEQDTIERLERGDGDWVRAFLELDVEHEPGHPFVYNSGASYMLSAIVQRVTGTTLLEYLQPRLFEPLGIEGATWETCPKGINTGGWGLSLRTPDLARFGQLYLDGGVWQGRRLVPAQWCSEATSVQTDNDTGTGNPDWRQGYGYQFWRCRNGAYRADGAFGQFCVIMPAQNAVLVTTSGVSDLQLVLDLVWEHLLPAMAGGPLPADDAAAQALRQRLASLALPAQKGTSSALAAAVSGRSYVVGEQLPEGRRRTAFLPIIRKFSIAERGGRWSVTMTGDENTTVSECGDGEWLPDALTLSGSSFETATSGGWTADDTFVMRALLLHTPFERTYRFTFAGDEATVAISDNVSFGPTQHPVLYAKAA
jgi:CubicO group peptidase (beta-lactamase class C family)